MKPPSAPNEAPYSSRGAHDCMFDRASCLVFEDDRADALDARKPFPRPAGWVP